LKEIAWARKGVSLVRFDPDKLREKSALLPERDLVKFFDQRGQGLPGAYDFILGSNQDAFADITKEVRRLFKTVKQIRLRAVSESEKEIAIELLDGTIVAPQFVSEGLLYYLAFAAIPYLRPASILLIDEPENGLHPSRIRDLIGMFREITKTGVQVIMATHSPLVVNELQPDEVTLVRRQDLQKGTEVTPITDTPNFAKRSQTFSLGELWVSYANGTDDLLQGDAVPSGGPSK
jgi:predicted ATPase